MAATDAVGVAGGIILLYNSNLISISNICAMCLLISTQFHILGMEVKGVVSNVYGPFQPSKKLLPKGDSTN